MKFYVKFLEKIELSRVVNYLKDFGIDKDASINKVLFELIKQGRFNQLLRELPEKVSDLLYFVDRLRHGIGYNVVVGEIENPVVTVYARVSWYRPGVALDRLLTTVPGSYYIVYSKSISDLGFGAVHYGFIVTKDWGVVEHEDSCAVILSVHEKPYLKIEKSVLGWLYIRTWAVKDVKVLFTTEDIFDKVIMSGVLDLIPSKEVIDRTLRAMREMGAEVKIDEQPDQDQCYEKVPVIRPKKKIKEPKRLDIWKELFKALQW